MTTLSMAEILNTAARTKKKEDKIAILRQNNSKELRNVLLLMYDKSFQLDLPDSAPPYTPSEIPESHGLLYREARKLAYFVKGRSEGAGINRIRKETIFIQMLEAVREWMEEDYDSEKDFIKDRKKDSKRYDKKRSAIQRARKQKNKQRQSYY